jgi:hypothetical protein
MLSTISPKGPLSGPHRAPMGQDKERVAEPQGSEHEWVTAQFTQGLLG